MLPTLPFEVSSYLSCASTTRPVIRRTRPSFAAALAWASATVVSGIAGSGTYSTPCSHPATATHTRQKDSTRSIRTAVSDFEGNGHAERRRAEDAHRRRHHRSVLDLHRAAH